MNLQWAIDRIFEGKAFTRPLFYSLPGGLRFSLSETGSSIEQFLLALRKAAAICSDLFPEEGTLVVCLRVHSGTNSFPHRALLQELRSAGIGIPKTRHLWHEPVHRGDWFDEDVEEHWINLAFEAPLSLLQTFLWCALAKDLGIIRPRPRCMFYLFNLKERVMAFPYDDRGMDIAGPNKHLLSTLYHKHHEYLLEYDRGVMDDSFGRDSIK